MKKNMQKVLMMAAVIVGFSMQAEAKGGGMGWMLGVDLSYYNSKAEATVSGVSSTTSSASTFYDVSFGYTFGTKVYFGGIYSARSDSSEAASVTTSSTANAVGAGVGYMFDSGISLIANYFASSSDGDYKKGTGMGVDFGWKTNFTGNFYGGFKLSYKSIKFTENDTLGTTFESLTKSTTIPYISLGWNF